MTIIKSRKSQDFMPLKSVSRIFTQNNYERKNSICISSDYYVS